MSHFWMQFSSDVAVFGRRCQFEILILPEIFQKDWHFVDHHLVDLWELCFCRKLLSWTEIWDSQCLLMNWDRFSCHILQKIIHHNQWKVMHLTFPAGIFGKTWHGRRAQCEWSFVQFVEIIRISPRLDSKQNTQETKCTIEKFRVC